MAFELFAAALALTIVVELAVAALAFRLKESIFSAGRGRVLLSVALCNAATNPLLNLLLYLNALFGILSQSLLFVLFLEALVVVSEAGLLAWARAGNLKGMLALSFAMNSCSFVAGIFAFGLPFSSLI